MNIDKLLNNQIIIVYIVPLVLGLLSVLSFQPFNLVFINFIIIPSLFLILTHVTKKSKNVYRKKPFLRNLFFVGYLFGIGFFYQEPFGFLIPSHLMILLNF